LAPVLGPKLGLPADGESAAGGLGATLRTWGVYLVLFLPGAVAGGVLGSFVIRPVNWVLGKFFRGFNWVFERATHAYGKAVGWFLRLSVIVLILYAALLSVTGVGLVRAPSGFVPVQDKGYLVVNIQLPDSASLERTVEVTEAVEKIALETPGVAHTFAVPGTSFVLNANSSNYGQHVRHPQAVRRAPGRGAHRRGGRGPAPGACPAGGFPRPACSSSRRRRCGASATRAGSS